MSDVTEYILLSIEGAGVNRATAERILAEHDAGVRVDGLVEAVARLNAECVANAGRALFQGGIRHATTCVEALADEIREKATPAGATATPTLTVYRASHDAIVMGLYTTAAAAREHCEAEVRREWSTRVTDLKLWWREDEDTVDQPEPGEMELIESTAPHYSRPTGYVVTPLEVASEYDEEDGE